MDDEAKRIRLKLAGVFPSLNEKQRRLLAAAEAKSYGFSGIQLISKITGLSRQTIYRGLKDLDRGEFDNRVRQVGGGRKRIFDSNKDLVAALKKLVEPSTRGNPESPLLWTCKSVRKLQSELEEQGFKVSFKTVGNILHKLEYSLQANRKTSEGKKAHPDRNEQFEYINKQAKKFLKNKLPVISVDTKKKELVGSYKNSGVEWRPKGDPIRVLMHDFPNPEVPKAVPYGVYDMTDNKGWVNVGMSADTAEFAVESIWQWWKHMGSKRYKKSSEIFICGDSGGSNSYRSHLWKRELQKFSNKTKMKVTVAHFPPGTSKWNKIEHRLFSYISMNWRGRPLTDYRTIVSLIASTKTDSGLTVKARLDKRKYKRGIKVSKDEIKRLKLIRHGFHGEWNYTIQPQI